ncbi:unnamed protein product, partial [Ectocarpus sp. 13 AM-2016]
MDTPATNRPSGVFEPELSPMSKKVRHFEKYSRKGGRWSWKRPSYERDVVNLVKTERRIEEGIASALTEVDAVEAGLRYFDELIIPQNKHVGMQQQLRSSKGQDESNGVDNRKASRDGPGSRSKGPRAQGGKGRDEEGRVGFARSEGAKLRDYAAAKKNGVGVGNRKMTGSDRAVSECVDLKLTLKQRLDNYDRQRGINVTALKDEENTEAQVVSFKQQSTHDMKAKHSKRSGGGTIGSNVEGGNQGGMVAPCCEGGATDAGSVGGILTRSLGNAGTRRRRRMPEGGGKGRSIPGSNQDEEVSAPQSRWRSWNEPPPRALLTAEEIRIASAAKTADERRRQPPPPEVIAEIIPPFRSRRRIRNHSGNGTGSDEKGKPTEHAAGVSPASGESEQRRVGCNGEGRVSTTTAAPPSSRRTAAGGVPLVPRVATLATPPTTEKNRTEATKKGKDFDPDQLECVRRHEASIAEKERMVHSIRKEAEKRTVFRARPLPAFLDGDDAVPGSVGDLTSEGCGDARGKGDKSGRRSAAGTGLGAAGTRPELLAALEQDEEARALVEKIRKINPRADIASIVLQSTPRTPLSLPLTSRINNGGGRVTRPLASRRGAPTPVGDATQTATTAATGFSLSKNNTESRYLTSVGVSDQSTPGLESEQKSLQSVVRVDRSDARERSEGRAEENHVTRVSGICERKPEVGQERGMLGTGGQQVHHHMATGASASATSEAASAPEDDGGDSGDPRGANESRRRSLMGRMLESGMLERQKEWAKARSKKVLESRRQVEAAKEQEGKGDALVAGLSGRSWSKAKTEHLRSFERQRKEEETREGIREARRRASELRAERERESAERRAAEIADTLAAAADAVGAGTGRESRTAPNFRGGGGRRRLRRPPPPRRARSHAGDEGHADRAGDGGGFVSMTANGRRQKREGEISPGGGNHVTPVVTAEANNDLSEDSFYRVAVEKIMEEERLGVASHGLLGGSGSGGDGGDGDDGGKSGAGSSGSRRTSCSGRSHGRSRKGAAADPLVFHLPRGAAAGRRTRTKSGAPMHQSRARGANGTPNGTVGRRRSWEIQTTRTSERHAVTPSTLSADRTVARASSLLSLYEAQSVEHVAGIRRDNNGPYLDGDDALGPSRGHTPAGWPGGGAQDHLTPAGQEQLSVLVATSEVEKTTWSGGAAGAMEYPWSDERRASRSRGSSCGAHHFVDGGTRLDATAATVRGSPRWDDVLNIGRQLDQARGTSVNEGGEHPR